MRKERIKGRMILRGRGFMETHVDPDFENIMGLMAYMCRYTMEEYVSVSESPRTPKRYRADAIEKDIREGVISQYLELKGYDPEDFIRICKRRREERLLNGAN